MTTFVLLRHAESTANLRGILAGQLPGTLLSTKGKKQSTRVAKLLKNMSIDRIISSPLERCLETVEPTAQLLRKRVKKDNAFIEMNYGQWSGRSLKELREEKAWTRIQKKPSGFTFPQGESFALASRRVERQLTFLARKYPKETILIVSHGDIIKLAIAQTLSLSLDDFQKIVVDPCSLTVINWAAAQKTLLNVNIPTEQRSTTKKFNSEKRRVIGGGSGV